MKCVVLCYHRVLPEGVGGFVGNCHRVRGTVVSVRTFRKQIADVLRHYAPVSLGDFVAALEGRAILPSQACLITFDDGYCDFVEHALPVLEQYATPCVLFVTREQAREPQPLAPTDLWYAMLAAANKPAREVNSLIRGPRKRAYDYAPPEQQHELRETLAPDVGTAPKQLEELGSTLYLKEAELRALEARGVALGGHGATHHALTHLSDAQLASNIGTCRAWLEQVAPRQPATIAYPYGRADARVARVTEAAGFCAGFTVRPCDARSVTNRFLLQRSCIPDRPAAIEEIRAGAALMI